MRSVQTQYDVTSIPCATITIPSYNDEKMIGRLHKKILSLR